LDIIGKPKFVFSNGIHFFVFVLALYGYIVAHFTIFCKSLFDKEKGSRAGNCLT